MQEYELALGMHRRALDPELKPFLLSKNKKIELLIVLVIMPIFVAGIVTLLAIFYNQELVIEVLLVLSAILFILGVIIAKKTYQQLREFHIAGSALQDLLKLVEMFGWRIQAALFPIIFLFILLALFTGNSEEKTSAALESILQIIGVLFIFIGALLVLNSFMNHLDSMNQRVMSLDNRSPSEEFRMDLKTLGKKMGFEDVKTRLGDLPSNYFAKLAIASEVNGIVYIAYSKIAHFQADPRQSFIYCARELCWLSLESRKYFYLLYFVHNTLYVTYLTFIGLMIVSISSDISLIHETLIPVGAVMIILLIIADAFIKTYLSSFELLLELKADRKTIEVLQNTERPIEEIKRDLRLIEKYDPLSTRYPGFQFRRNALHPDFEKKDYWDKL